MQRTPDRSKGTLGSLGEDEVVRRLTRNLLAGVRRRAVIQGPGDDCAVIETPDYRSVQLFKTDCVIEGVHFLPNAKPEDIGWKALCRAISDIAAMGGMPSYAVITVAAPKTTPFRRIEGIYRGLKRAAAVHHVGLVGGETSSTPKGAPLFINVALLGEAGRDSLVLRSGANLGDVILVTGVLGGTRARWHLKFKPRLDEAFWLARNFKPTSMMDLSDGLAKDLPRLAKASGVGYALDLDAIPRRRGASLKQALTDGEDFELLLTMPPKQAEKCLAAWKQNRGAAKLTRIGEIVPRRKTTPLPYSGGWDHFS